MKFNIPDINGIDAWGYINTKLKTDPTYLANIDEFDKERSGTKLFRTFKFDDQLAVNLTAWCKKYLTEQKFNALCASLRKKNSRRKHNVFSVVIDNDTYNKLNDLSAVYEMTIKDCMSMLIEDRYQEVDPPVAKSAKVRRKK